MQLGIILCLRSCSVVETRVRAEVKAMYVFAIKETSKDFISTLVCCGVAGFDMTLEPEKKILGNDQASMGTELFGLGIMVEVGVYENTGRKIPLRAELTYPLFPHSWNS